MIVVSVAHRGGGVVVRALDHRGEQRTYRRGELSSPIAVLGVESLPKGIGPNSPETIEWAREQLTTRWQVEGEGVGGCPNLSDHLAAVAKVERLEGKLVSQQARSDRLQGALVRQFEIVADILHERGYAHEWQLTAKGAMLTGVHGEAEAVLADALDQGDLVGLDAPELAAVLSSLIYELRGLGPAPSFRWPSRPVRQATARLQQAAESLRNIEQARLGYCLTKSPDPGIVATVYAWAQGDPLEVVLTDDMTGGDFVRSMRMVVDLCRQVASVADGELRSVAGDAVLCVDRGVVRSARDRALGDLDAD